ncbi:GntR family transcriptional regulator [Mycolicibacterium phlei]|jgi:GntR family transcriptional regulator|uniref:GntR family transcriptional regulator n=1 Tax=Mycolicibacterium phlei DSM 43239 = CCUG 21000 TaxID=1226750 RepID=A0A5N5UYM4_MYCPH|nr:GntR family transcriptional regulator [Mycolicibacterium phlei]VEG11981.1 GntR family transcriptional regulator [Mycobacteroides chelonae]AMO63891.1 HTH-type transcriptional repressor PhnF [Mycolicibacterium phlei]EID09231.1 GntR family transcriptional regulator [Mycolicibacterium phlei RIVM601174]KAB7754721.1 GntR family transcriptional regulator [Mycolicibacterium phlei DSM 43239 = CCUG 21000]KXW65365.1 GntR family transcriptional regulator [Mycolicibacterium phlei DSM 43239 = CCUG 21000]
MTISKAHRVRTALDTLLAGLDVGDPVPAERDLAARFNVARETVRQALHELLVEGRIERRGRGTVVSHPKLVQPLSLRSYTEGAERMGHIAGRRLVSWEDIRADANAARALGIRAGTKVMRLERVLLADAQPIGLETTYLAASRFGWLRTRFDPETSLYAALRDAGVEFAAALERIETVLPSPREAELLGTTTAMPALLLNRRTVDSADEPIELVRALYRGDRVAFEAMLVDR